MLSRRISEFEGYVRDLGLDVTQHGEDTVCFDFPRRLPPSQVMVLFRPVQRYGSIRPVLGEHVTGVHITFPPGVDFWAFRLTFAQEVYPRAKELTEGAPTENHPNAEYLDDLGPWYCGQARRFKPTDSRHQEWRAQREERGFDDSELFSLDLTLCAFLLPRLSAMISEQAPGWDQTFLRKCEDLRDALSLYDGSPSEESMEAGRTIQEVLPQVFTGLWF